MNVVLLFLVVQKPDKKLRPPKEFITERLGFDENQTAKFLEFDEAHHRKMRAIDDKTRILKEELFTNLEGERLKKNELDSIGNLIGALAKDRELEVLDYFKKIEQLCDEKQKLRFKRIVRGALRKGPHGQGPPHKGPPPPR